MWLFAISSYCRPSKRKRSKKKKIEKSQEGGSLWELRQSQFPSILQEGARVSKLLLEKTMASSSSSSSAYDIPWVEKYRPTKVCDIVGNLDAVARLGIIARDGNMPNLILAVRFLLLFFVTFPSCLVKSLCFLSHEFSFFLFLFNIDSIWNGFLVKLYSCDCLKLIYQTLIWV